MERETEEEEGGRRHWEREGASLTDVWSCAWRGTSWKSPNTALPLCSPARSGGLLLLAILLRKEGGVEFTPHLLSLECTRAQYEANTKKTKATGQREGKGWSPLFSPACTEQRLSIFNTLPLEGPFISIYNHYWFNTLC